MLIEELSDNNKVKYDALAVQYGTIFNSLDWLKMFGEKVKVCGIYDKGNNLIGGFTTYKERRLGLSIYRNPPFTPVIGPFLKVNAQNPVAIMDAWKKAVSLMADFIEDRHWSVISFSLDRNIVDTQPFIWKKFKVVPGYTYIIDLNKPMQDVWKGMSAIQRNHINKATRDGLIVKQVWDFGIVKSLLLKTFLRQATTFNEYYLDKILFDFANEDNSFAHVTFKDNNPIAASFCVYDKSTAYYLISGYDYEDRHHGAGAWAVWEAIQRAKELSLKRFDFEGSMISQIECYFRGFGGTLTPYYRINKARLPLEMLLKFFKRDLF